MHHKEDFAETNIQAILFADSFQTKFLPLSQDVPKVLMPVANVSMIDYTIKFLKDNRIKDIIVFTSNNRSKLEEYFRKVNALEKKKKQARTFNINVFSTEERSSVGQALRDIHHKGWIQSEDILLIFGDVVASFDLSGAISQHMAKKKDRNILTKIFKKVPLNSPLRTEDDDCVVIVDNNTSQVLQYKHIGSEKDIDFNLEKIDFRKSRNNIEVHYDWIDTDISICNKEVFHLINENLYNDFRDDLIYDILTSEIVEERIHAHVLSDSDFAAKVSDYRTYGIINQYITSRWLYPIVPSTHDLKLLDKNTTRYTDFNVYVDEGVNIGYTAKVSKGSVLGKDTNIDEGSVIERSVLGKNCKIGKNVKIIESIIWNNVTINNDCVLDHCIVADGAIIGANTHVQPGVVLSQNTEVAANSIIPTRTLISSKEGVELPYLVKGKKFEDKDFTLRDEEFLGSTPEYFKQMQQYPEETEEEDEEEDETGFKEDVANLLEASIKDKVEVENIAIELESSRLRANATFSDCIVHAVPIIFQQIQIGDGSIKEIVNNLNQTLTRWAKLFKSIVRIERDEGVLIEQVEEFCKEHQAFASAFHLFLQFLYKLEILGAGMIIEWGKEAEQSEDEDVKKHYKLAEPFVNFLKQQEEEDDEEEEEEEEEEGEDEDDS